MKYITLKAGDPAENSGIGGKAKNLFRLNSLGMNVPDFVVIPAEELLFHLPKNIDDVDIDVIKDIIRNISISDDFIDQITREFSHADFFAVRSSAMDEDGASHSFAGQFESYLYVRKENLAEKIKAVWLSAFSKRISEYRKNNKLTKQCGIAVIVQEMIASDAAGVAFGINPVNGNQEEKIINSVFGLGEGIVSGELNADHFILNGQEIRSELAVKTHQIVLDIKAEKGTILAEIEAENQHSPSLNQQQIREIGSILDQLMVAFDGPQDIEFAYMEKQLYLLQTRPITGIQSSKPTEGEYILWDNSNIIESYPGVITPLTFSFVSQSYEGAYRLFCAFMGVDEKTIETNKRVFQNTLGLINGRIYYNLKTWYHMLAMLPGYSINARFMEKMMGVKERFDIPETYRLSKVNAWWRILKMVVNMYRRFLGLPRSCEKFMALLDQTISKYKKIKFDEKNANELMQLYLDFESTLLNEWKAPLLNDFFAMIWFGRLQKKCEKYELGENPNIHNDLLCGSNDIISVQPIHRSIALATLVNQNGNLRKLFQSENAESIWNEIKGNKDHIEFKKEIDRYIADFGERCVGELKLETISYAQNPSKLVKVIKSYVDSGITASSISNNMEETLRKNAEALVENKLKFNFLKKWSLRKSIKKTRELVSARENLRFERTRAFGMVREIFNQLGARFHELDIIDQPRDIFYLAKEEIFSNIEGTAISQDLKALIQFRKSEFASFEEMDPPAERFATYGPVYHGNDFFGTSRVEALDGDLKGIGCCPGRVRAKVQVVLKAEDIHSLNGDILVTSSTDPGWVTLFPSAAGIIVERGSLLSHSAIVSREMGKPCIVGVTGLLKTLKTGDEIEMDGASGQIRIIHKA